MTESTIIDRQSYEPAYAQLIKILKQQIASGKFLKGSKLPSESRICKVYQVSPMTVRRAINALSDQGVITTIQGKGTFVKNIELGASSFDLKELQKMFQDRNRTKIKILESRIVSADNITSEKLNIQKDDRLIYLRRLILRDHMPFLYHQEFLIYNSCSPIVESQMDVTSLDGLINGSGDANFKKGELSIVPVFLCEEEIILLQTDKKTLAFRIENIFYDFDDNPVSYGWFICPTNRLQLTAKVGLW